MTSDADSIVYVFGTFCVDPIKRILLGSDGRPVALTPKVFDTLLYLVEHAGIVIDKDELMSAIWPDTIVEENNLNKNISALRRVLGEERGANQFVVTVPGKGYKFVASVTAARAGHSQPTAALPSARNSKRFTQRLVLGAILVSMLLAGAFIWQQRNGNVTSPGPGTIAILPFKPLVAENRDESLELGMADTLIGRLGGGRGAIVRPLSSVRKFGGLEQDAMEAGRALGVDSVMDGSIQHWGDRIRVNVRLIKVADGSLIWTDTFDEKFTNIFVVQDAIANRVAAAMSLQFSGDKKTSLEKRFTNNADAYALYLRGRYHVFRITEADIRKGISFYERAIEMDPNYALAYAEMADAYRVLASASFARSKEVCPQAKAFAEKSLQIDSSLAEPHIVLGWVGFLFDWDWEAAEKEFLWAIELSPNNSEARRAYAHMLSNAGRHEEAIEQGRRARELAPLTLITAALEGQFLSYAGRHAEAIERLVQTIELDPTFWPAHNILGRVYLRQGRYAEAIREFSVAADLSGSTELMMQLGYAFARSGEQEKARAMISQLEILETKNKPEAYKIALIYNGLGENEKALEYLSRSFDDREVHLTFIKVDTRWDNLRSDERFIAISRGLRFN